MSAKYNATVVIGGYEIREPDHEGPWLHLIQPDGRSYKALLLRWFEPLPEGKRVLIVNNKISEVQ